MSLIWIMRKQTDLNCATKLRERERSSSEPLTKQAYVNVFSGLLRGHFRFQIKKRAVTALKQVRLSQIEQRTEDNLRLFVDRWRHSDCWRVF